MKPYESVAGNMYGRVDAIEGLKCIDKPMGCGRDLTRKEISTWNRDTQKEYSMSGWCRQCQNQVFNDGEGCTCHSPCCEADIGVGIVTCGSQHCPEHGYNDEPKQS